jgi:DNA-binding GntR family transcriptional regulator
MTEVSLDFEPQTTPERIAQALRESVMRGGIAPGTPLREPGLMRSLGVSRNTVREALRLLASEGLVRHDPFRGVSVAKLSEEDVRDIYRARLSLELAGVDVAEGISRDQVTALRAAARAFEEAVRAASWLEALNQDLRLHSGIVAAVGSRRLTDAHLAVLREVRLGYFTYGGSRNFMYRGYEEESIPLDLEEHRGIVELIASGELERCKTMLRRHVARSERLLLERVREGGP